MKPSAREYCPFGLRDKTFPSLIEAFTGAWSQSHRYHDEEEAGEKSLRFIVYSCYGFCLQWHLLHKIGPHLIILLRLLRSIFTLM